MSFQQSRQQLESKKGLQDSQITKATNPLDFYTERGFVVIETENGWANYYVMGEMCFLQNMFVYPNKRRQQNGTSLLNRVEMSAKEMHNCKKLITTISTIFGKPEPTMIACFKRGFKFSNFSGDTIILEKEI